MEAHPTMKVSDTGPDSTVSRDCMVFDLSHIAQEAGITEDSSIQSLKILPAVTDPLEAFNQVHACPFLHFDQEASQRVTESTDI